MNHKTLKRSAIVFLLAIGTSVISLSSSAAELTIKVTDIKKMKGHLLVALYESKEAYDGGETQLASKVKVDESEHLVIFKDIPEGQYAVKMYHDENDNNELDSNMFGIPSEGYGFSNNEGRFGAPDYKDAMFEVNNKTNIEINLF